MRDKRFVAANRGGLLAKEDHRRLARWARECSEHILHLIRGTPDLRLIRALSISRAWEYDQVPTVDAMRASLEAHAAAREAVDPIAIAASRSVGQAVAAAHMADRSLGAALYALEAVERAGGSVDEERKWQRRRLEELSLTLAAFVPEAMKEKERGYKLD